MHSGGSGRKLRWAVLPVLLASVMAVQAADLSVGNVAVVADTTTGLVVSGNISGQQTYEVTILLEIVPRAGATGIVQFTIAPPTDIVQSGDPWPSTGTFSRYDTDLTGAYTLNGTRDDNGTFLPGELTFSGPLASFPVVASADADGVWDLLLATPLGNSEWAGLTTTLAGGTVTAGPAGTATMDSDADGDVDLADFAAFQTCFTGDGQAPTPACQNVFDSEPDSDVDLNDFEIFAQRLTGPLS